MDLTQYLDDLRHALAVMWTYNAWAGNISAGVLTFVFAAIAWPRARRAIERFVGETVHAHLAPHLEALHHHIEQATGVAHDPNWRRPRVAGRVGPHVESHEPRLLATQFVNTPASGYLVTDVTSGITDWGMDDNDDLGCCGFAMLDHANVAKSAGAVAPGSSFTPPFADLAAAYFAYGIAQGEPGPEPDQGVSNATMLAWAVKQGLIDGYAEVPLDQIDWFVGRFSGVCAGLSINDATAQAAFTAGQPWDAMTNPNGGHDVLIVKTGTDGSGELVTWGRLQPFTAAFRQANVVDAWVILDKNDPAVNWPALEAALAAVHGTVSAPGA